MNSSPFDGDEFTLFHLIPHLWGKEGYITLQTSEERFLVLMNKGGVQWQQSRMQSTP